MYMSKPLISEIFINIFDYNFKNLSTARRVLISYVNIIFEKASLKN